MLEGKEIVSFLNLKIFEQVNDCHVSSQSKASNELSHLQVCIIFCDLHNSEFRPEYWDPSH